MTSFIFFALNGIIEFLVKYSSSFNTTFSIVELERGE